MKRIIPMLALLASIFLCSPAWAVTELIKAGATTAIPFLLVDSATGQVGQTGDAGSVTVTVYKPGGSSFVAGGGTITELGNGDYVYSPTSAETASCGLIYLHITCSSCQTVDTTAQVVAFDPTDANALGLSDVAAIPSASSTASAVWSAGTRTITGGSLTTAPPTTSQIAAAILANPANLLTTNGSGYVTATNGGSSSVTDSSVQADATAALNAYLATDVDGSVTRSQLDQYLLSYILGKETNAVSGDNLVQSYLLQNGTSTAFTDTIHYSGTPSGGATGRN